MPCSLNGSAPRVEFNPSGSVLFLKTETVPFGINAVDPFSLSTLNGPITAQFSVSRNFAISRDGARLYGLIAGDQIRLLDLSEANEAGQLAGFGQTGVAGEALAQPLTIQMTGSTQELTEGGFVQFGTTPAGGDFGYGDQLAFGAADANGQVSTNYTTGLNGTGQDTINVVSAGGNFTAFLTVVPDTSLLAPSIVNAVPQVGMPAPGVNTVIAVDFTKAIVPAHGHHHQLCGAAIGGRQPGGRHFHLRQRVAARGLPAHAAAGSDHRLRVRAHRRSGGLQRQQPDQPEHVRLHHECDSRAGTPRREIRLRARWACR